MSASRPCTQAAPEAGANVCKQVHQSLALVLSAAAVDADNEHSEQPARDDAWPRLRTLVNEAIEHIGPKQFAWEVGVSPAVLANNRMERGAHKLPAHWLPAVVAGAPNDDVLRMLADLRGLDVVPKSRLTPEQIAQRLTAAVLAMPEGIAAAILELARVTPSDLAGGRALPRRAK